MGKRGPQKGAVYQPTKDKAQAREALRAVVIQHMDEMVSAQIAHAKGLKYLIVRNIKTGKFERVSKEQMEKLLDAGDEETLERLEIWEKEPSVPAFSDLLNRALDKPADHMEITGADGGPLELINRLAAARKRLTP